MQQLRRDGHKRHQELTPSHYWLLLLVIVVATTGMRLYKLDADPPGWYIPEDIGFHIDEGYKTLDAKNRIVFGTTHWNADDDYKGWSKGSPLTQQSYYLAYKTFGLNLASARSVNVLFFALFLIAVTSVMRLFWGNRIALFGAALLAIDPTLYNFSRVALFEMALVLFIYVAIALLVPLKSNRQLMACALLAFVGVLAALSIKMSALVYLLPLCAVLIVDFFSQKSFLTTLDKKNIVLLALVAIPIVVVLYLTRGIWMWRIAIGISDNVSTPQVLFWNNLALLSPFLVSTAYLCIIQTIAERSSLLKQNLFRLVIVSSIVILPTMLNFFGHNPPRYSVPIVPAAILVILDWLNRIQANKGSMRTWLQLHKLEKLAILALLLMIVMSLLNIANTYVVTPLDSSEEPGLSKSAILMIFPAAGLAALALFFIFRNALGDRQLRLGIVLSLAAYISSSIVISGTAAIVPSYSAQAIKTRLEAKLTQGQSVAGDWAPFFTADSLIPSLYMAWIFNSAENIEQLRPDYFLYSNTYNDQVTLDILQKNPRLRLEVPTLLGNYHRDTISLYRVHYLPN